MRVFDSKKTLTFGLLLLAFALVVHGAVPRNIAAVKDISIAPSGDMLEAQITTTGPATFTYFELSAPRRLVVVQREAGVDGRCRAHPYRLVSRPGS